MQLQQGQGQMQQKQQVPETPMLNDRDILNEMISLEKHASNLYHTATIEASNPSLHQSCSNIMQETLQCQRKLFQLMSQKGWYSPQNADQQQVSQAYQKFQGYMQSQFPQNQ
ncbi:spore coat protein [Desulfuribacillus alkaliarsenatis]|uniref:Coat protein F n=1 Tax=Desulfuribacillus alkaliarsenatis TaxID=766136 RepID=A0A1E5G527_9FIRM|nr:spore coat protein [Desulfuribacillus alkaliarsenatis]OEF98215.1 hypothetical protein BHF68_00565 [Desulfuribacillus alkaliarsenatis]